MTVASKPFANCYWVEPDRLLAGEHPLTMDVEESAVRIQNLLLLGITRFINLTTLPEMPDYAAYLPGSFGGRAVGVERIAIRDHDLPDKPETMNLILDRIAAFLDAGEKVYVHCRAGIGRTGTVMGCYLARQGTGGDAAIERLNRLWSDSARSATWPVIPETEAQEQFIHDYGRACQRSVATVAVSVVDTPAAAHATAAPPSVLVDRFRGALLGMAIAEALVAQQQREPDTAWTAIKRLDQAAWGADTAMTWALADSLVTSRGMQPQDQLQRYGDLIRQRRYRNQDSELSLSPHFTKAVALWQWRRQSFPGAHDPALLDAHTLARSAAVALFFVHQPVNALLQAAQASRTTLQSPLVLDAVRILVAVLSALLQERSPADIVDLDQGPALQALRQLPLKPAAVALLDGGWRHALQEPSGDDVMSILASALHGLLTGHDYVDVLQRAMSRSARPAAIAATCGLLAGARFGWQGLPIIWRETLSGAEQLRQLADRLLAEAPAP